MSYANGNATLEALRYWWDDGWDALNDHEREALVIVARTILKDAGINLVRDYLLNHPDAVEDNGRVTIDVPVQFAHRAEVTTRFLADWLAPEPQNDA